MFVKCANENISTLIVYVDDIVVTGGDPYEASSLKAQWLESLRLKTWVYSVTFLGLKLTDKVVAYSSPKKKYVLHLLQRCRPVDTPIEVNNQLGEDVGTPVEK